MCLTLGLNLLSLAEKVKYTPNAGRLRFVRLAPRSSPINSDTLSLFACILWHDSGVTVMAAASNSPPSYLLIRAFLYNATYNARYYVTGGGRQLVKHEEQEGEAAGET